MRTLKDALGRKSIILALGCLGTPRKVMGPENIIGCERLCGFVCVWGGGGGGGGGNVSWKMSLFCDIGQINRKTIPGFRIK